MSVAVSTIPGGARLTAGMTCPRCEGVMVLVARSEPNVREWRAVMRCQTCQAEQLLLVQLLEVNETAEDDDGTRPPCGTNRAYIAHWRRGDVERWKGGAPPCVPCQIAHNDAKREWRARKAAS